MKSLRISTDFATIADVGNVLMIVNVLAFAYMAASRIQDPTDHFFDPVWRQEGFCVQNRDVPYWNSHDICFYFDTIASVLLAATYYRYQSRAPPEANDLIFQNLPGILCHGMAHWAIGKTIRDETFTLEDTNKNALTLYREAQPSLALLFTIVLAFYTFWLALLKGTLPTVATKRVALIAAIVFAESTLVPSVFAFTYVQTILMMSYSTSQLLRPPSEKNNFTNASLPYLAGIPCSIVPWIESTQCDSFVRDAFYGHLIFDAAVPLCLLVWYLATVVWRNGVSISFLKPVRSSSA